MMRTASIRPEMLLMLVGSIVTAGTGCKKEQKEAPVAPLPRVTRYNCNIAERRDIVDVYAEVVNESDRATARARLVVRIERPGKPDVTGSADIRSLKPREAYRRSLRVRCKGRVRLHQIDVSVEPAQVGDSQPPAHLAERHSKGGHPRQ